MTVYVDDAFIPFKAFPGAHEMLMCHMWADTREELDAMADAIGVDRKWIQYPDNPKKTHYDVGKGKRALALKKGAVAATWEDWGNWREKPVGRPGQQVLPLLLLLSIVQHLANEPLHFPAVGVAELRPAQVLALALEVDPHVAAHIPSNAATDVDLLAVVGEAEPEFGGRVFRVRRHGSLLLRRASPFAPVQELPRLQVEQPSKGLEHVYVDAFRRGRRLAEHESARDGIRQTGAFRELVRVRDSVLLGERSDIDPSDHAQIVALYPRVDNGCNLDYNSRVHSKESVNS